MNLMNPGAYTQVMSQGMNPDTYLKMAEQLMKPEAYAEWYESTVSGLKQSAEDMTQKTEQQ